MFNERGYAVLRTDKYGAVLSEHHYQAFGKETTTRTSASGAATDPWGFGAQYGYYTDNETGYVYCTFRYYDPSTGRWLSQDPIGLGGGQQNLYAYCGNNPINFADPLGLRRQDDKDELHFNPSPELGSEFGMEGPYDSTPIHGGWSETFAGNKAATDESCASETANQGVMEGPTFRSYHYSASGESDFENGLLPGTSTTNRADLNMNDAYEGLGLREYPHTVYEVNVGPEVEVNSAQMYNAERFPLIEQYNLPDYNFPRGSPRGSVTALQSVPAGGATFSRFEVSGGAHIEVNPGEMPRLILD